LICVDPQRDPTVLCVVEQAVDVVALGHRALRGRYHALGGALSPLEGAHPEDLASSRSSPRIPAAATFVVISPPTQRGG
jgi:recombination protein RecR